MPKKSKALTLLVPKKMLKTLKEMRSRKNRMRLPLKTTPRKPSRRSKRKLRNPK